MYLIYVIFVNKNMLNKMIVVVMMMRGLLHTTIGRLSLSIVNEIVPSIVNK